MRNRNLSENPDKNRKLHKSPPKKNEASKNLPGLQCSGFSWFRAIFITFWGTERTSIGSFHRSSFRVNRCPWRSVPHQSKYEAFRAAASGTEAGALVSVVCMWSFPSYKKSKSENSVLKSLGGRSFLTTISLRLQFLGEWPVPDTSSSEKVPECSASFSNGNLFYHSIPPLCYLFRGSVADRERLSFREHFYGSVPNFPTKNLLLGFGRFGPSPHLTGWKIWYE